MTTGEAQYLLGKIQAVSLLASTLATVLSPAAAKLLLVQCAKLREQVAKGAVSHAYAKGFLEMETQLQECLKTSEDADKIRQLLPGLPN